MSEISTLSLAAAEQTPPESFLVWNMTITYGLPQSHGNWMPACLWHNFREGKRFICSADLKQGGCWLMVCSLYKHYGWLNIKKVVNLVIHGKNSNGHEIFICCISLCFLHFHILSILKLHRL